MRSLGRRNLTVAGLDISRHAPAFSSRWCTHGFVSSGGHGTDAYLSDLEQVLDRTGARVLIPAHDGTIALLRRHRARLERRVRIALANETAMTISVNKEQTLAIAKRLGIAVPPSVSVATADDVPRALKDVGLPAVVKPSESWIGAEGQGTRVVSRLVTTPEEAFRAASEHMRFGGVTLFQPFIPGRREAMSFLYANGKVYARFAQWAKRTNPPLGGDSVLRQSIAVPADTGDQAERLVREIDLDGYSEVEFRRDRNGVPYLMEINPRLSASVEMAVRSGVDFPLLVYQWASGEPMDQVDRYRTGGWMRYLRGDLSATAAAIRERGRPGITPPVRAVLDFGAAFFRPMGYDYLDWQDLLPAARATADFTRSTLGKMMGREPTSLRRQSRELREGDEDAATVRARRAV